MKTLIIGGGLSGLALAEKLEDTGHDYHLLEARPHFGGRISTQRYGAGHYDMGPAWFWPGQPRIATLVAKLGLKAFHQFSAGEFSYEDASGRVQRGHSLMSMEGSLRLEGGFQALVHALEHRLPEQRKERNARVIHLSRSAGLCRALLSDGRTFETERIVLAMPPRLAAQFLYEPALPDPALADMAACPTWMAGQAKAVAVYEAPFWREKGLSGHAMSHCGPLVEIHDASPASGGPYALFGFFGPPPRIRREAPDPQKDVVTQLTRLFGEAAGQPNAIFIKDWAMDPLTATQNDMLQPGLHPRYGLPESLAHLWDGQLVFAGTEVAREFGGYIEGALEAAEAAAALVQ